MNNGPRKGGSPATVKLLESIPSIQAAYQLHQECGHCAPSENTDPALIANETPREASSSASVSRPTARSSRSRSASTASSGRSNRGSCW